jgi:hypothetical protein
MREHGSRARIILAAAVTALIAGGAYAFTDGNTVPISTAGAVSVSGYVITNLHYTLDATIPTNIDALTFNVSPVRASTGRVIVQAALSTGGPINYPCTTDTTGANVTCATITPTQLTAALLVGVTVVAAQ